MTTPMIDDELQTWFIKYTRVASEIKEDESLRLVEVFLISFSF